jgi:hypothetical protein
MLLRDFLQRVGSQSKIYNYHIKKSVNENFYFFRNIWKILAFNPMRWRVRLRFDAAAAS